MTTNRPNILFAFADDWGRYASVYRRIVSDNSLSSVISTPTIDRIANEGALFTNALVPAPTCTPCRSSLLSGRYFWQTRLGAILEGAVWDENISSYPRILENAGYHTGATWEVWGPGVCAGVTPYGTPDHYYEEAGTRFNQFSHEVTAMLAKGMDNSLSRDAQERWIWHFGQVVSITRASFLSPPPTVREVEGTLFSRA